MSLSTRIMVLVSALLIFGGCSLSHKPLSSSAPTAPQATTVDRSSAASDQNDTASTDPPITTGEKSDPATSGNLDHNGADLPDTSGAVSEENDSTEPGKKIQSVLDEALESCQTAQENWQKGELDAALDSLDRAYALINKVDPDDNPELIQQKDDLRFTISQQILQIYASRNTVNGNHNEIPMVLNDLVKKEIKSFQGNEKEFFLAAYRRSGKYRTRILKALEKNGLPPQLSWLPLIESGFKVHALSGARALGLWQFIPSTGYKFGLNRNTYIDERLDPEKATAAAITYLTELHQIFGDWMTVLAAYNCGEGKVLRVIRDQGANYNYLDNFWDLYQRLPMETARYVPRFLAMLHIISDPAKYGFVLPDPDPPLNFDTVSVNRQVGIPGISKALNVPEEELKTLNPELRYNMLPNEPYTLRVPPGKSEQLLASIDQIAISYPPQPAYAKHKVRTGETLSTIAAHYHSNIRKIMAANNLKKTNYIVAGKILKIPLRGTYITSTSAMDAEGEGSVPKTHIVQRGDSLWIIAKKYGTTTQRIQALNGLTTRRFPSVRCLSSQKLHRLPIQRLRAPTRKACAPIL